MEEDIIQIEEQTRELVYTVLSNMKDNLLAAGFSSEKLILTRSEQTNNSYDSEVEITFWVKNELIDIIEFPVFREGTLVVHIDELKKWLEEKVKEVIEAKIATHGGLTRR